MKTIIIITSLLLAVTTQAASAKKVSEEKLFDMIAVQKEERLAYQQLLKTLQVEESERSRTIPADINDETNSASDEMEIKMKPQG